MFSVDNFVWTRGKKVESSARCRKRLSQLLHTHVALITVCFLSALDASCVLGQIICDILIMTENQHSNELVQKDAVQLLNNLCSYELNHTSHDDSHKSDHELSLKETLEILQDVTTCNQNNDHATQIHSHDNHPYISGHNEQNNHVYTGHDDVDNFKIEQYKGFRINHAKKILNNLMQKYGQVRDYAHVSKHRSKRAAGAHGDSEHIVLYELTHAFHLGSMVILSLLLLETFLKMFSMGQKFLRHKLEVFDAFVVTVSWCLDIGFWQGLWAHPGTEAATILIVILPWRVIRIVNSFVLVIQEKDMVLLKLMKQQYRILLKKERETKSKLEVYRIENRQFQGLCRKHGVTEDEIQACVVPSRKRRRSSIAPAFSSFASLAMIGAVGSTPDLKKESSDEEDDSGLTRSNGGRSAKDIFRSVSIDSDLSTVNFSLSPDPLDSSGIGSVNTAFSFDSSNTSLPTYEDILTQQLEKGTYTRL